MTLFFALSVSLLPGTSESEDYRTLMNLNKDLDKDSSEETVICNCLVAIDRE